MCDFLPKTNQALYRLVAVVLFRGAASIFAQLPTQLSVNQQLV